jgi:hypothetical protein
LYWEDYLKTQAQGLLFLTTNGNTQKYFCLATIKKVILNNINQLNQNQLNYEKINFRAIAYVFYRPINSPNHGIFCA